VSHPVPMRRMALCALVLSLAGCTGPLLDRPSAQRQHDLFLPPLVSVDSSPDGTSWSWSALFWLLGQEAEADRRHARALPFWWHDSEPPYLEQTLLFPLWFSRETHDSHTWFVSLLYGRVVGPETRTDYVLPPIYWVERAHDGSYRRSSLLLAWDESRRGEQREVSVLTLLGLATLLHWQGGLPPEGEAVGAEGRSSSRRIRFADVLGLVTLAAWDDAGDRRDVRLATLFSNERWSLFRSWRGRGDDPFVREWLFPLYINVQDADRGWSYVGPLWGGWREGEARTDWWALGLLARNTAPEGVTWRVLGLPVVGP
jgi:hypothetical protein